MISYHIPGIFRNTQESLKFEGFRWGPGEGPGVCLKSMRTSIPEYSWNSIIPEYSGVLPYYHGIFFEYSGYSIPGNNSAAIPADPEKSCWRQSGFIHFVAIDACTLTMGVRGCLTTWA
jgi:hypothetical protein